MSAQIIESGPKWHVSGEVHGPRQRGNDTMLHGKGGFLFCQASFHHDGFFDHLYSLPLVNTLVSLAIDGIFGQKKRLYMAEV